MKKRKHICAAVLAHVDAGKTTLSEAMLYLGGKIRKAGRVDKGDTFFDTDAMERKRGITIFAKQAELELPDMRLILLDTPGHVDFSAEMERTLSVLDYAVLVISGADGVQAHTKTLWQLLKRYQVPVFIFINKMDRQGIDKEALWEELKQKLAADCVNFTETSSEGFFEEIATCGETALEQYLKTGSVTDEEIRRLIFLRRLFPCYYGSALLMDGVDIFLEGLQKYTLEKEYPQEFGARVFKIARDAQGRRLTYLKVTGGCLKVRQMLCGRRKQQNITLEENEEWEEKVSQIRIYSGEKYETADEVPAGGVCAVLGLNESYAGEGLGIESASENPFLEPVLTYRLILPDGMDAAAVLPKLRQLEEEEPQLHIVWDDKNQEIQVKLMGEVQVEILKNLIFDRFGLEVSFGSGNIVYKETIADRVEGVGHFEPLRHYAEVHLLLEPLEEGSGLQFAADCSEDILDRNWQRLILTHLMEKEHVGVLTGSALTDMKITLKTGRAHQKHTEGGDFRQATYRAVRQGLMQAQSVLLEPFYLFTLEVPEYAVGRAMTDVERMHGKIAFDGGVRDASDARSVLVGRAPVSAIQDYQKEVIAYTKGQGRLTCTFGGYQPCHDAEEVIERIGYDAGCDMENPADSVFCAHGAGFIVEWYRVPDYMHLDSIFSNVLQEEESSQTGVSPAIQRAKEGTQKEEEWIDADEVDKILSQTFDANKRGKSVSHRNGYKLKGKSTKSENISPVKRTYHTGPVLEEYLLVDGYNIIFAWEELSSLAADNIDGARGRLLDMMCNYQGMRGCHLIVVFDAYRIKGHETEYFDYHNIHVVYTKTAETADQYIEKFAHENGKKYQITVATSDGLEQIIIRGAGCGLLSARDLKEEVEGISQKTKETYIAKNRQEKSFLLDGIDLDGIFREEGKRDGD